jgi:DNA ligase 1
VLIADLATTSAEVSATAARGTKVDRIAELLRRLPPTEAAISVAWLSGELTQRQLGIGWAALRSMPPPAQTATLTIAGVDAMFTELKSAVGAGSRAQRRALLWTVFATATESEQGFMRRLLSGDLRQGALAGIMTAAIAKAAAVRIQDVRRAAMVRGDLPSVAVAALTGGAAQLAAFRLEVGRPVSPMLAQTATGTDDALRRLGGEAAFEWKLDGARVQIHRDGQDVAIFTRSLDEVTGRLPEVVDLARALPADSIVADSEVIALRPDGRPQPFQVTASRIGSSTGIAAKRASTPLTAYLFDVLSVDGSDLLDDDAERRLAALARLVPPAHQVGRIVTADAATARAFLDRTLALGHEGIVAKSLRAPYEAGRRGAGWLKVKPVHTLDLVVLAVEQGSGRRTGTLSNIHLGARDPEGGFVMLGKTFKGMTDAMLRHYTERFLDLADGPADGRVVRLRPEQVVEIAFDGIQRSSRYPGGVALRFARVVRYRDDKRPEEADTIDAVRTLYIE